jgi:hypothetical protein
MSKRALCTFVVALLCVPGFASGEDQDWAMNATIMEACSCMMFRPCYFKNKPTGQDESGHYCKFNMAVHVNSGHDGEASLEGAKFWLAGNLAAKQAVLTFDAGVTAEQRAGIHKALGKLHVPVGGHQRNAQVGDHVEIPNGQIALEQRVGARVLDEHRYSGNPVALAERMGQRRLAKRAPWLGQPDTALEKLPVGVDQRHQGDRCVHEACGQPRQPVEGLFRRGVE